LLRFARNDYGILAGLEDPPTFWHCVRECQANVDILRHPHLDPLPSREREPFYPPLDPQTPYRPAGGHVRGRE
jgi:hypothetical protein